MITKQQIATLRALLATATPGPYRINRYDSDDGSINWQIQSEDPGENDLDGFDVIANLHERDLGRRARKTAELIAAAVNALPELLSRIEELEAENNRLRHGLSEYVKGDELVYGEGHTERSVRARAALEGSEKR